MANAWIKLEQMQKKTRPYKNLHDQFSRLRFGGKLSRVYSQKRSMIDRPCWQIVEKI
jgi:hypothetical protein